MVKADHPRLIRRPGHPRGEQHPDDSWRAQVEKNVSEENYLRVELVRRSPAAYAGEHRESKPSRYAYENGVLTSIPKREAKPKQIKVNVATPAMAAAAGK